MKRILIAICTLAALMACNHDNDDPEPEVQPDRTVLIYISGENNLNNYISEELDEMRTGSKSIGNNVLLAYVDAAKAGDIPVLVRIKNGQLTDSTTIAEMGISQKDEYASDPRVMEQVVRYAFNKYPSVNNDYGLVLWGHASGWVIADSLAYPVMARRKAYGGDTGGNTSSGQGRYWLNIPSLAKLLSKNHHLSFIFADCCNFQCLESAYELRNVCDYMIGSPAEIPGPGAPYELVVPAMFQRTNFATAIADKYYIQRFSNSSLNRDDQNGELAVPLSVIKLSEMEQLAQATRTVLSTMADKLSQSIYPNMNGIIHYYYSHKYFDANDFIRTYASEQDYASWKQAYDRVVIYKLMAKEWMTNVSWSGYYKDFEMTEEKYGGTSMFVPQSPHSGDYYSSNTDIKKMAWYYAAGLNEIGW